MLFFTALASNGEREREFLTIEDADDEEPSTVLT
jgi:hypothetical protein